MANDVPAYFNVDGEETQLRPLQTPFIRELCSELNVIIGETPASTTSTTQPCDAGDCFLGAKSKKKHIKKPLVVQDEAMNIILREVIKVHEASTARGKFQVAHIKMLIAGVQMVQYVLSTTMRRDMIVKSFAITGQYDTEKGGCNVERILGQCKSKFTTEEVTKVWELLPSLCKLLKDNGELKEKDFEPLDMYGLGHANKCRDTLVLNRCRFIFLTNRALVASEFKKKADKELAVSDKAEKATKKKSAIAKKKANPPAAKRARKNPVVVAEIAV